MTQAAPLDKTNNPKLALLPGHRYRFEYPRAVETNHTPVLELIVDDTTINATYTTLKGTTRIEHNLRTPLTIGRAPANILATPDDPAVSGNQASIGIENSEITYTHLGRHPLDPPTVEAVSVRPDMWYVGGDGAGVCDDNPRIDPATGERQNPRKNNEDRALAMPAPDLSDNAAPMFLKTVFDHIVAQTSHMKGGSTLSMGMRTKEGHYACAHITDSPIFLVAHNVNSNEVSLVQVSLPHNIAGATLRHELKKLNPRPKVIDLERAKALTNTSSLFESSAVLRGLGLMTRDKQGKDFYIPDVYLIKPAQHLKPGFECKGLLICSDGVDKGVKAGDVQTKLAELFTGNASPTPQEISRIVVDAAKEHSFDNISAVMLPENGQGLIAVADGNTNTARVADRALDCLYERCLAATQGTAITKAKTSVGAALPPSQQSPALRRNTAPPPDQPEIQ